MNVAATVGSHLILGLTEARGVAILGIGLAWICVFLISEAFSIES